MHLIEDIERARVTAATSTVADEPWQRWLKHIRIDGHGVLRPHGTCDGGAHGRDLNPPCSVGIVLHPGAVANEVEDILLEARLRDARRRWAQPV